MTLILPNVNTAIIDIRKLTEYVLNTDHPEGKHKARVFKEVLGITLTDVDELIDRIQHEIRHNLAVEGKQDQYGKRYAVEFGWSRKERTATVVTGWIIKSGETTPRLTSCYIKK